MLIINGLFLLALLVAVDGWCKPFSYGGWHEWGSCSASCGGGTHRRVRYSCVRSDEDWQTGNCHEFCYNGGSFNGGSCHCSRWRSGSCCQGCRNIHLPHCKYGRQECGGSPDNVRCSDCENPYYGAGWGHGCHECPKITNCERRHCSNMHNTKCDTCQDDNVLYKRTHLNTKCERMCSFDNHPCWPGICSDELTTSCKCADGFRLETTGNQITCQLIDSNAPSINKCQTKIVGPNGEAIQTEAGLCNDLKDFYGNFHPTLLAFDMQSDFIVDISSLKSPKFISEETFGITDTFVHTRRITILGNDEHLDKFIQKIDTKNSTEATTTVDNKRNYTLPHPKYILSDGESLCIQFEAFGGGYVKTHDFRSNTDKSPVPYQKTRKLETICYKYDNAKPQHCMISTSCLNGIREPLQIENRITRTSIIPLSFSGWTDPVPVNGNSTHASGIESYEITVNEVLSGIVHTDKVFSKTLQPAQTQFTLNLTSDGPRLYSISLGVKDVADNVQIARRFVLYDSTTNITTRKDKPIIVTSASKVTEYKWQTHHNDLCINWKHHFYNTFYMENSLLVNIKPDPNGLITGVYEQENGLLPVNGTLNTFGITQFHFASSLNGGLMSSETPVLDIKNQLFCKSFSLRDGQTYTLLIKATDIVNNTFSENITLHIDRTVPHINNLGLIKNGEKRLFVHDSTDLSMMNLSFDVLDPHSGILNIEWSFGTSGTVQSLGSGHIGAAKINQESCTKHISSCYCPDVGECEKFTYNVPLNMLVRNNTHKGNHNRNYFFTIKATNNARLSNVEHVDVLVDDSPPQVGEIYEGAVGTPDIDYISDTDFQVRWQGFIDHESGIKEYIIGLADTCLHKEQLLTYDGNSSITEYTKVLYTESSVRMNANFTGKKYVSLIAINNALEASEVACSDGITRDDSPPDLKNIILKNGKWSESLFCHNGIAWLFRTDMRKVKLPDNTECQKRCVSDSPGQTIYEILPIKENFNNDTSVGEFICKNVVLFDLAKNIYLSNDDIDISWDISEAGSQIEDFYIGFGRTTGNSSDLTVMDYTNTNRKHHFRKRHIGTGGEDIFYIYIKTVNKAKLETITSFGPILIDETPPYFHEKPSVVIENGIVKIGWNNDTVVDPEQRDPINQMFFQIVHDRDVASPVFEWRFEDSKPCPGFTGGCFKYPLKRLQVVDTDEGLNFTIKVQAYNNAGHFVSVETEKFKVPSRYPPGHAVVRDTDPGGNPTSIKDVDVHFTAQKLCAQWIGFKHHENVTLEIGIGTSKAKADLLAFQQANSSSRTCIKSSLIHFNTKYFFHLRASCSGGTTIAISDGVTVVNENNFLKSIVAYVGKSSDPEKIIWSERKMVSQKNQTIFCPTKSVQVGKTFKMLLKNILRNVSVFSNDIIFISKSSYDNKSMTMTINAIPVTEQPCVIIDKLLTGNDSPIVCTTLDNISTSKRKLVVSNTQSAVFVRWAYAGLNESISHFTFEVALGEVDMSANSSRINAVTTYENSHGHTQHFIRSSLLYPDRVYSVIIKPCTSVRCIGPIFSQEFKIESSISVGHLQSFHIELDDKKSCVDVVLSWKRFEAKSDVAIYQWSISKDDCAKHTLTGWETVLNNGEEMYDVRQCVHLPVLGHSTLYMCVKAYSVAGNTVTTCKRASVMQSGEFNKDSIYDIDASVDVWKDIKQMIHSSNIGSKYSLLHDAEMDFGNTNTSVVGTLMYATERNVTWYLMKNKHLPFSYDCDQDSDCIHSTTTDNGYVLFDNTVVRKNIFYFTCAYSNATSVSREHFKEILKEITSCSNGFIVDDSPPIGGNVNVENTDGFIASRTETKISWNGFDDDVEAEQLGYIDRIKYYSYAVGTRPGGEDITNYTVVGSVQRIVDMHQGIADGTGIFVSVKATDHAGLSTEVYSDEMIVDATPPTPGTIIITGNNSYISASTCELILLGFKDDQSSVDHYEVGIGSDIALVDIRPVMRYSNDRIELDMSNDMHDGHVYFITVKAVNQAELSSLLVTTSFTLDRSAPTGGHVLDGNWETQKDIDFQQNLDFIQGHWKGFTDSQSGIRNYKVGLGTKPRKYDIEAMVDVGLRTDTTWNGTYEIGKKYYITVEACNAAGLCRCVSSDGIVLDNSQPVHGIVKVGSGQHHQSYLPNGASIHISWFGFEDPQSGIDHYEYCIGTKASLCDETAYTPCLLESSIIRTGLNLTHSKSYYVSVKAVNKAGSSAETVSDTFTIDDTPPVLVQKPMFNLDYNAISGEKAQWDKSVLRISWKFEDAESRIATHTITLKTHHEGHYPVENIHLGDVDTLTIGLDDKNWLNNGDNYFVVVTSCNTAGLCSTSQSDKLLIDSSPPHQGGFKPPMSWQNFIDAFNSTKSKITVSWYGFADAESGIDLYFLTVSRNYNGQELSGGIVSKVADNNQMNQNATIMLNEALVADEILILTIWAKNSAGLNSSVSRISVTVLSSMRNGLSHAAGIIEIQKHSCDIHFCNKDCTCAVLGQPCVEVAVNDNCTTLNATEVQQMNLPEIAVFGGMSSHPQNITVSSACLAGHWIPRGDESLIQRYEWSMGIKDFAVGHGIFKSGMPWKDVGKEKETIYCLSQNPGLEHNVDYQIYVRAWYSKNMYAEFRSIPIHVDQTPPHHVSGKYIKDSDVTCSNDYDVINWMDKISACWNKVFTERQGEISYYYVSVGTTVNGSDIYERTHVGLQTNITLVNISLSHGTKYYVTVTAYNNVGLHTTLSSDGFVVDMDTPISGVVFNTGKHTDTTYQSSNSIFSISWHGFIDQFSGIKSYHAAVVEHTHLHFENVSFTDVGLRTKYEFRSLSLTHGKSYIGLVKAVDNAGHFSDVAFSSPKTIDTTAPESFDCQEFKSVNITTAALRVPGALSFYQDIAKDKYYLIRGVLEGSIIDVTPILSIGRNIMPLTAALNNNGSVEFEYSFLSSISGETKFSVSAFQLSVSETNFSIQTEMLVCTSEMETTDTLKAVELKQIGPSKLAAKIKIIDRESALYKVELGAGTTPGGFQLRPLTIMYGDTSGVIDIEAEHGSQIYVTAVAENHAGLRSIFKAAPITFDKTPPMVSEIESTQTNYTHDVSGDSIAFSLTAQWDVLDHESDIKYCLCGLGKLKGTTDIENLRLSDTMKSCVFRHLHSHHGDTIFVSVRCINNVELATEIVSDKITVTTDAPQNVNAQSHFVVTGNLGAAVASRNSSALVDVQTFIQTDRSKVILEWFGFEDLSGIEYYEYRLLCRNETVVGWRNSGKHTMMELKDLELLSGNRYAVEVRAVNSGLFTSVPLISEVIVHYKEPQLTGKPLIISRNEHLLRLDWSDVFHLEIGLASTYDVIIGSKRGYTDVLQLQRIEMNRYDVTVPQATIITPNVQEVFITITCTYPTGIYTLYQSTYKI